MIENTSLKGSGPACPSK